jgi:hypothetical protein
MKPVARIYDWFSVLDSRFSMLSPFYWCGKNIWRDLSDVCASISFLFISLFPPFLHWLGVFWSAAHIHDPLLCSLHDERRFLVFFSFLILGFAV